MAETHVRAAKKRLAHLTPEQKSRHMSEIVKKGRWAKTSKAQRSAHARKMLEARYNKNNASKKIA